MMSVIVPLSHAALGQLMPLFLLVDAGGVIRETGPCMARLNVGRGLVGSAFDDRFIIANPHGVASISNLLPDQFDHLHICAKRSAKLRFRGHAVTAQDGGMLLNLSFGLSLVDAVQTHDLTAADFAPTDLAIELLYLVEAKTAAMSELRRLTARLDTAKSEAEAQASTDALTGLLNRRALEKEMSKLFAQRQAFSLIQLDLDFFKAVNDNIGHHAGDAILINTAKALLAETRDGDRVVRMGGDEFVVLLVNVIAREQLADVAGRIINQIGSPLEVDGKVCQVSASLGISTSHDYDRPNAKSMIEDADRALYASKDRGRGTFTIAADLSRTGT